jgi:hypothetical protein
VQYYIGNKGKRGIIIAWDDVHQLFLLKDLHESPTLLSNLSLPNENEKVKTVSKDHKRSEENEKIENKNQR